MPDINMQVEQQTYDLIRARNDIESAAVSAPQAYRRQLYNALLIARNNADQTRLSGRPSSVDVVTWTEFVVTLNETDLVLDQLRDWYLTGSDPTGRTVVTNRTPSLTTSPAADTTRAAMSNGKSASSTETTITDPGTGKQIDIDTKSPIGQPAQTNWVPIIGGVLAIGGFLGLLYYYGKKED